MKTRSAVIALVAAVTALSVEPAQADDLSPAALLAQYQPVIVLSQGELFAPTSVDDFLADASLQVRSGNGSFEPAAMPEAGLPVHGDGWRLDHRCAAIDGPASTAGCYDPASLGPSVIYGRHEVIAGTTVLSYWLFYEHNLWTHPAFPFGAVWQAHEGDWEVVHVVLDDRRTPVEAAYSQHCTGARRPWSGVQKVGERPVVYVARGSHANYFAPGVHAFAAACVPPPARQLNPVDLNVPDATLASIRIELVHASEPRWLRFPGTWGETQYLAAPLFGIPATPFGTSPLGPAFQDDWLDPLGTIAGYGLG